MRGSMSSVVRKAPGGAGAESGLEKGEGSPEAKFGLCSHTWHLKALDLVLLGSGTGPSPAPPGLCPAWHVLYAALPGWEL